MYPQPRSLEVPGRGEEALLATATPARALAEALNNLVIRLHDFADWQLVNVTETDAVGLEPELAALRRSLSWLTTGSGVVLGEVDTWCARLGQDWPESDELFVLSMGRLSEEGDPRWRALAAWWRSACSDLDDSPAVDEFHAESVAAKEVSGRG